MTHPKAPGQHWATNTGRHGLKRTDIGGVVVVDPSREVCQIPRDSAAPPSSPTAEKALTETSPKGDEMPSSSKFDVEAGLGSRPVQPKE